MAGSFSLTLSGLDAPVDDEDDDEDEAAVGADVGAVVGRAVVAVGGTGDAVGAGAHAARKFVATAMLPKIAASFPSASRRVMRPSS